MSNLLRYLFIWTLISSSLIVSSNASNYSREMMEDAQNIQEIDIENWLLSENHRILNKAEKVYIMYKMSSLNLSTDQLDESYLYQRIEREVFGSSIDEYLQWINALVFIRENYSIKNLSIIQKLQNIWVEKYFSEIGNHHTDFFNSSETLTPASTLLSGLVVYAAITRALRGDVSSLGAGVHKKRVFQLAKESIKNLRRSIGRGGKVGLTRTGYVGSGVKESKDEKKNAKENFDLRIPISPAELIINADEMNNIGLSYNESRFYHTIYGLFGGLAAYNMFVTYASRSLAYYRLSKARSLRSSYIVSKIPTKVLRFPIFKAGGAALAAYLVDKGIVTFLDFKKIINIEKSIEERKSNLDDNLSNNSGTFLFYSYATAIKEYAEYKYQNFWNNYLLHTSKYYSDYYCEKWDSIYEAKKYHSVAEVSYMNAIESSFKSSAVDIDTTRESYSMLLSEIDKKKYLSSVADSNYLEQITLEVKAREKLTNLNFLKELSFINMKDISKRIDSLFNGEEEMNWYGHMDMARSLNCRNYNSYIKGGMSGTL